MSTEKCPHCNSILLAADALFCDMCGERLTAPSIKISPAPTSPVSSWEPILAAAGPVSTDLQPVNDQAASQILCPKCNSQNPADYKYCHRCGTKLV